VFMMLTMGVHVGCGNRFEARIDASTFQGGQVGHEKSFSGYN
jgi:hypothetical protein